MRKNPAGPRSRPSPATDAGTVRRAPGAPDRCPSPRRGGRSFPPGPPRGSPTRRRPPPCREPRRPPAESPGPRIPRRAAGPLNTGPASSPLFPPDAAESQVRVPFSPLDRMAAPTGFAAEIVELRRLSEGALAGVVTPAHLEVLPGPAITDDLPDIPVEVLEAE